MKKLVGAILIVGVILGCGSVESVAEVSTPELLPTVIPTSLELDPNSVEIEYSYEELSDPICEKWTESFRYIPIPQGLSDDHLFRLKWSSIKPILFAETFSGLLYVIDYSSKPPVVTNMEGSGFRFSPDEKKLAYVKDSQIAVWDIDTQISTIMTNVGENLQPVWSPNGSEILFLSDRDKRSKEEALYELKNSTSGLKSFYPEHSTRMTDWPKYERLIYIMDADGENQRLIALSEWWQQQSSTFRSSTFLSSPSWSPDGSQILFYKGDSESGLFSVSIGSHDMYEFTDDTYFQEPPFESIVTLDGKKRVHDPIDGIYLESGVGKPMDKIIFNRRAHSPAISPDGTKIAYLSVDELGVLAKKQVMILDFSTTKKHLEPPCLESFQHLHSNKVIIETVSKWKNVSDSPKAVDPNDFVLITEDDVRHEIFDELPTLIRGQEEYKQCLEEYSLTDDEICKNFTTDNISSASSTMTIGMGVTKRMYLNYLVEPTGSKREFKISYKGQSPISITETDNFNGPNLFK